MILITPLCVLVHLSAERNVLLILKRKVDQHARQQNGSMCNASESEDVPWSSDQIAGQKVKYKHQIWASESEARGNVFSLCIELNILMQMQICSTTAYNLKGKVIVEKESTFLLLYLQREVIAWLEVSFPAVPFFLKIIYLSILLLSTLVMLCSCDLTTYCSATLYGDKYFCVDPQKT